MREIFFRICSGVILFTCIGISFYFRRKADRETGEKISRNVDGSVMMNVIKIGALVLWLSPLVYLVNPDWMEWSSIGLPHWIRWLGVVFGILCIWMVHWLFISIGSGITPTSATRKEHRLVTRGPYRWIRHPLYTFGSSIFVAFGLIADNWYIILLGILAFVIMAIRTPKEEANLIEKFGNDYREYMKTTGRFLPLIKKR